MKTINKDTKCLLEAGEVVAVCIGGSKILCVVRRCGKTPCTLCAIRDAPLGEIKSDCSQWKAGLAINSVYTAPAAFVPVEDIVE